MKDNNKIFLTGLLLAAIWLIPHAAIKAQAVIDPAVISSAPDSPAPGDTVVVTVDTPTFDKNTTIFSWAVDGKVRPDISGQGKNTYSYIAGDAGTQAKITVSVSPASGFGASVTKTISVQGLSMPWFAEDYVPLWYKGKALPSPGSIVDIVAVPEIIINKVAIRPENLIYHWSLDGVEKLSGVGERVFKVETSSDFPKRVETIDLLVEDISKQVQKQGSVQIKNFPAKVLIYPSSPLGGIENRSVANSLNISLNSLLDLIAEPFFLPVTSKSDLPYKWTIGNNEVQGNPKNPYLLTVDTGKQGSGNVPVSVSIDDSANTGVIISRLINLVLP